LASHTLASTYDHLAEKGHFAPESGNELYAAPLIGKLLQNRHIQPTTYLEIAPGGDGMALYLLHLFPSITDYYAVELSPRLAEICAATLGSLPQVTPHIIVDAFENAAPRLQLADLVLASFVGPRLH